MKHKFFKFLLSFVFVIIAIGIWFSQNWYKMPKYIGQIKNPTVNTFTLGNYRSTPIDYPFKGKISSKELSSIFFTIFTVYL